MTIAQMKELALHAAKGTAPANYSTSSCSEAFLDGLKEMAGSINQFMKNRYDLYDIIIDTVDEIVPNKVIDAVGIFADVQIVPQGTKAMFRQRIGRSRAKKFLTQVGISGVYESFRLDTATFEVSAHAVGGAVTIDFERMLDGAESLVDLMDVITDSLSDSIYVEVQRALRGALNASGRPAANKYTDASFVAEEMVKLVSTVRSYGGSAVIFAPPEFVAALGPDAIVPVGANYQGVYHPQDLDAIHNQGYINIFRGTPVVQIPQSFTDENNVTTWIDPQIAYVLPTGGERVVKVVLEGQTQMWDYENRDRSMEVNIYKKMGVAILAHHNWAIYQNTGIAQTMDEAFA